MKTFATSTIIFASVTALTSAGAFTPASTISVNWADSTGMFNGSAVLERSPSGTWEAVSDSEPFGQWPGLVSPVTHIELRTATPATIGPQPYGVISFGQADLDAPRAMGSLQKSRQTIRADGQEITIAIE